MDLEIDFKVYLELHERDLFKARTHRYTAFVKPTSELAEDVLLRASQELDAESHMKALLAGAAVEIASRLLGLNIQELIHQHIEIHKLTNQ